MGGKYTNNVYEYLIKERQFVQVGTATVHPNPREFAVAFN